MDIQTLLGHFRTQVADEAAPYLWSEPEALAYLVDAQDMFVRLTGGIADVTDATAGTPATRLVDLSLSASNPYTAVSPYILRFRRGFLLTAKRDINFINQGDLSTIRTSDYGYSYGTTLDDSDTGDVHYAVLGVRRNYVRWVKVPNAVDTCRVTMRRLPYPRIASEKDALEIGEEHHIHLVKWMKHLAYSKQDEEVYDKQKAADCAQEFRTYCQQAKTEVEGREYKPRQVQYGGIPW